MWGYTCVTREAFEAKKDFIEQVMIDLGAKKTEYGTPHNVTSCHKNFTEVFYNDRKFFHFKQEYFRVSEVLLFDAPCTVLEWTDNLSDVQSNTVEDLDPLPYDLSDEKIIEIISEYFNQAKNANQ